MSNMKPDNDDDDGFTKEYTKNKENVWKESYLKDWVGFQLGAWQFQTSEKKKVNKTENRMKLEEVCVEIWWQATIFRA